MGNTSKLQSTRSVHTFRPFSNLIPPTPRIGWAGMALTEMVNLNVLRIFRVIRLLRAGRLLISVPELYILLSGFELKGRRIVRSLQADDP